MSAAPQLSIGFPVFNGETYLEEALDSLLCQTYTDFELIISDNASTDNTAEICTAYAAKDSRIRFYRNKQNIGVDRNFNRTAELARGKYFRWSAADDVCAPDLLARCVAQLDADEGIVLCYPQSRYIDEQSRAIRDYADRLHLDQAAPHSRLAVYLRKIDMCNAIFGVIRTDVLRQTKLCGIYSDSDIVLLGELSLYGRFYEIPAPLFFRRIHPEIAIRKYPTAQERMVMSQPEMGGKLTFPHWQVLAGFFSAIRRAPLGLAEEVRCYREMRYWLRREQNQLKRDLGFAKAHVVSKLGRGFRLLTRLL